MFLRHPVRLALALLAAAVAAAPPLAAQPFVKVNDFSNPIVTDAGQGAGGYTGASWIDHDEDGHDDLFVNNRALYRNLGGGSFAKITIAGNANSLGNSWADVDNDGDADLMITSGPGSGRGSRFFRNDGGGLFTKIQVGVLGDTIANVGWACAWGDYDADGQVDVVIAQAFNGPGPNRLLRNLGGLVFERDNSTDVTTSIAPHTVPSWSDFDLDGDLDLSIGTGPALGPVGPDYFYRNRRLEGGTPLLSRITTGALATDQRDGQIINWIDVDNDRDLDVYITNYNNRTNDLYRNDGGAYVKLTGAEAGPIVTDVGTNLASVWGDYDNDGDLDCLVTRDGPPNRFYRNLGGGLFDAPALGALVTDGGPHFGAANADYDEDGDLDLFVTGATKALFRNDLAAGSHWLELRLRGVQCNRSAIGARVHVLATIGGQPVWQMREVSAQNSFNGHSALTLHFGLGDAATADSVVLVWPNGRIESLPNVTADRRLLLVEGQSSPTPVALALAEAAVRGADVALTWYSSGDEPVAPEVQHRHSGAAWATIGAPERPGPGRLAFVDRGVATGRHGYRLSYLDGGERQTTAEVVVEVGGPALAVRQMRGAPFEVELSLPRAGRTKLEVLDVTGRIVRRVDLGVLEAGTVRRDLGGRGFHAGLYLVRVLHEGERATAKCTLIE